MGALLYVTNIKSDTIIYNKTQTEIHEPEEQLKGVSKKPTTNPASKLFLY